jgi:hypothetical protein
MAIGAPAQVAHPRIWLDAPTTARLQALVAANDPTWVALKAHADTLLTYTIPAYDRSACASKQICYTYEGSGWQDALVSLSLAYKMTGNTAYAAQVKALLAVMEAAGAQAEAVDSGYPSRYIVEGLAIAYDWIYDQLSASDKTAASNLLDAYWTQVNTNGYLWANGAQANPYSNYTGGHIMGFGLAMIAFEGDDANVPTHQTTILGVVNNKLIPAMETGAFAGGFQIEGWNYGPNNMVRLFQFFWGMNTAGKSSLLIYNGSTFDYTVFCKTAARSALYSMRSNGWRVIDEGSFPGSYAGIGQPTFYLYLALYLGDATEGQWMRYLAANGPAPPGGWPSGWTTACFDAFLTANSGTLSANWTSALPTASYSPGDFHSFVRSDWTTNAVHTSFNGTGMLYTDHQDATFGQISIFRQNDYLLVDSGEYDGQYGWYGSPEPMDRASWKASTLYVADSTLDSQKSQVCLSSADQYYGCGSLFNATAPPPDAHLETQYYTHSKVNFTQAYGNNHAVSPFNPYYRTFLNIGGDVSFVFDRVTPRDLAAATINLFWHVPSYAATTTLNGNIASNSVGNSTLWIATVLPASPILSWVADTTTWGGTTPQYTQRLQVADPNAGTNATSLFLTVLAPVAATATQAAYSLVDAVNMKGAIYDDGTYPRVAFFSTNGSAQTTLSYVASYTPGVTARHVVLDLKPGVYTVRKDGQIVYPAIPVQADGSLTFTASAGGTFAISPTAVPPQGVRGKTVLLGNTRF